MPVGYGADMLRRLAGFIRGLFRKPRFTPGTVEETPEMKMEKERRRGMRGD